MTQLEEESTQNGRPRSSLEPKNMGNQLETKTEVTLVFQFDVAV